MRLEFIFRTKKENLSRALYRDSATKSIFRISFTTLNYCILLLF